MSLQRHRKNPGFPGSSLFHERGILLIMGAADWDFQVSCPGTLWWHLRILAAHCKLTKDWGRFKASRRLLISSLTILTRVSRAGNLGKGINCLSGCGLRAGGVRYSSVLWYREDKRERGQDLWVKGLCCLPLLFLLTLLLVYHLNS